MTYFLTSLGQIPFHQSGGSVRWGMPMPIQAPGPVGPAMATTITPRTGLRWGDPVSITGPFAGLGQGHVRVKFAGAPAIAPQILGPFQASVQVPEGAQTGECWVEIDGRHVFGGACEVVPARTHGVFRPGTEEWRDFGPKGLHGMGYFATGEVIVGELPPEIAAKIKALEAEVAKFQKALVDPQVMSLPNVRAIVEGKLAAALAEIKRLRQAPAKTRVEASRQEVAARRKERQAAPTAPTEPGAPVEEKKFPILLVAGLGAAAVLAYVLLRRRATPAGGAQT